MVFPGHNTWFVAGLIGMMSLEFRINKTLFCALEAGEQKPRPLDQLPRSLFVHIASIETHWLRIAIATAWALSLAFSLRKIALM
jgi:hypothetical protein